MNNPKVTVLMPVYNGERFLKEAIESILTQTFTDFEFLIINDGSTDKSIDIIMSYNDPRIRLIHNEENLKLIASLNKGINLAKGKYIARMDCDDISMPSRLEKEVEFLDNNYEYGLVGTWFNVINADGQELYKVTHPTEDSMIKLFLTVNCPLAHGSIMGRTELFRKNLYGSEQYFAIEDYELWTRLAAITKIYNIPEYLFKYRVYGESFSDTKLEAMAKQTEQLGRQVFSNNKKIYISIINDGLINNDLKNENKEIKKYIGEWINRFVERLIYVNEYGMAFKLYLKSVNNYGFKYKKLCKNAIYVMKSFIKL